MSLEGDKLQIVFENIDAIPLQSIIKKGLPEETAKLYAAQLIIALEYLHHKELVYILFKLENMFLTKTGNLALMDYGVMLGYLQRATDVVPPEIEDQQNHTTATDCWLLGVMIYYFFFGIYPRVEGLYSLDEISFSGFSQAASDLLLKILNRKPDLRIKIPEIKAHRFFEGIDWEKISKLGTRYAYNS